MRIACERNKGCERRQSIMPSIGIVELLLLLCVCAVPVVLVAAGLIALVVFLRRRPPQEAVPRATPPQPAPLPQTPPAVTEEPSAPSEVLTKSCPACGAENPLDNDFCEYCGAALDKE
jgi:hypothetical protein